MEEKFERQCQSCGMPLKNGEASGTEADGSKNHQYCNLCYQNGGFCDPNMSLEQMRMVVDTALKEKGWWAPLRWMAQKQLPSLKRWRG